MLSQREVHSNRGRHLLLTDTRPAIKAAALWAREGSKVKRESFLYRGLELGLQHPQWATHKHGISLPLLPSTDTCRPVVCVHTCMRAPPPPTHLF